MMRERQVTARGRHRAQRQQRRSLNIRPAVSAVGVAGVAIAGAAVLGVAPTLTASPQLMATLHYLRGTNIGGVPTDGVYEDFIGRVLAGSGVAAESPYVKVPYNAGFRPFSHGGFGDLTYDASVQQGVDHLAEQIPAAGDVIFGYSQGAVVASKYKETHTGNTYVLVENPSRPNGGVLERFEGWKIPIVDVTFSGPTPNNGDPTIDVARQYDGWADFPRYLWNAVAVANAFMGIVLIHGNTQTQLTADDLDAAEAAGSDYYQFDADSNTKYYVIRTYPVPLLMPLQSFLPASAIAAMDVPLRKFIETAYDRSDYSEPAHASFFKPFGQTVTVNTPTALVADNAPAAGTVTTNEEPTDQPAAKETASHRREAKVRSDEDTSADDSLPKSTDLQADTSGDDADGSSVGSGDASKDADQATTTTPAREPSQPHTSDARRTDKGGDTDNNGADSGNAA